MLYDPTYMRFLGWATSEAESRIEVAGAAGVRQCGLMDTEFVREDEKVLETDNSDGCTIL